jgi:tetratricopeptide (TPR) repeat protein
MGVRATDTTAALFKQFNPRAGAPPWAGANANLQQAMAGLIQDDLPAAEQALKALDPISLPPQPDATRWMLWSALRVGQAKPQEALDAIDKAEAAKADMPILWPLRAKAYNQLGKHKEALEHADKYVQTLGGDADAYAVVGEALEGLGRTDEAAATFARGLADAPGSPTNAAGLARTGGKADWLAVLRQAADPQQLLLTIADEVRNRSGVDPKEAAPAADTLDALVAAYRKVRPADPWAAYYEAEARFLRKQYVQAAAVLETVLASAPEAAGAEFQRAYVQAMLEAGKSVEAYGKAPDPLAALKQLAWQLQVKKDWTTMKGLVAAHRSRVPKDAWGPYYQAIVTSEGEGRHDDADALFAEALKFADDGQRGQIRHARVSARAKDGKGLLAYEQADDRKQVFNQLAWLYSGEKKPDELEKLVAAHRRALPTDPILSFWEAEVLFLRKDYAAAEAKLTESRAMIPRDLEHMTRDRLVRSLIRQGRHEQALRQTRTSDQKVDDPYYRLMGLAAKGDVAEAMPLMSELIENEGYELAELYEDEDIGPALAADAMKPVREKYPRPKEQVEEGKR